MSLNPSNFLILNAIVVGLVIGFLLLRKPKRPSRLRLANLQKGLKSYDNVQAHQASGGDQRAASGKLLNVIFVFNGHSFDAYEALGLPAGCSLQDVEAGYRKSMEQADEDSHDFLNLAYQAILKKEAQGR